MKLKYAKLKNKEAIKIFRRIMEKIEKLHQLE
jgi:hypothetical protein